MDNKIKKEKIRKLFDSFKFNSLRFNDFTSTIKSFESGKIFFDIYLTTNVKGYMFNLCGEDIKGDYNFKTSIKFEAPTTLTEFGTYELDEFIKDSRKVLNDFEILNENLNKINKEIQEILRED